MNRAAEFFPAHAKSFATKNREVSMKVRKSLSLRAILLILVGAILLMLLPGVSSAQMDTVMTIGTNTWYPPWGGGDPWRNGYQNAVDPSRIGDPDYNPWNSRFLEELAGYSVIRFMDFGVINWDTVEVHWEDRVRKEAVNQRRMALYWMIDLCNRTQKDMWICLPERSAPDYWEGAATLIRDRLDPALKVYVEWSNETWNPMFSAHRTAVDSGKAYDLWFPGDEGQSWGEDRLAARFTTFQALRIWKTFYRVFGDDAPRRVVRVLCGASANDWWDAALVNALADSAINPDRVMPDAFAIAPYVGHSLDGAAPDIVARMNQAMGEVEKQIRKVLAVLKGTSYWHLQMPPPPEAASIPLICYEAGQHILKNAAWFAANQASYDWYMGYLDMLSQYIRGPVCHYTHSSGWGDMAFGAKKYVGQPVARAPKFRALWNWSVLHRPNPGPEHHLEVWEGEGTGDYVRDFYVLIRARTDTAGVTFSHWEGDTAFVEDAHEAETLVRMPDRDISLRAVYRKVVEGLRLEAEDAELVGLRVSTERPGYSGSGYVDGSSFDQNGDSIVWRVHSSRADSFRLVFGYGGFYGEKWQYIRINGGDSVYFHFPATNEWATQDYGKVFLHEGENTIAMEKSWGWMDVDYLDLFGEGLTTGVRVEGPQLPGRFALLPNFPNPFNPETTVPFELSRPGEIRLVIFDLQGRRVRVLVRGRAAAGRHQAVWDGRDERGREQASGIYLCVLCQGWLRQTRKLLLIR